MLGRTDLSGRDQYREHFRTRLHDEARWLEMGARQKVDSIDLLLTRNQIEVATIIELGSGTGAVVLEMVRRGIGRKHYAVDYSQDAIDYLQKHAPEVTACSADVTNLPRELRRIPFDLVVASHVLEHLEEPQRFLRSLHKIQFHYLLVEVPLENLPAGRLKGLLKDRRRNRTGHVQFFNARDLRALLEGAGYKILDERRYAPVLSSDEVRVAYQKRARPVIVRKQLTENILPRLAGSAWRFLYHAHFAALCVRDDESLNECRGS